MNISTIIDMIKADPTIVDDITAFLKRVNEQNQRQIIKSREVIIEEEVVVSFAELNGGIATERDVEDAIFLIKQEPLLKEIDERSEKIRQLISTAEIKSTDDITNKFVETEPVDKVESASELADFLEAKL